MTDDTEMGVTRRTLRRVVPMATTDVRGGIALTLFALEDYTEGFDVRGRLVVPRTHAARIRDDAHALALQARLLARAEEARQGKASHVMPMVFRPDFAAHPDELRSLLPRLTVAVRDDRGNTYDVRGASGAGSFGEGEFGFEFLFRPALDLAAKELRIEVSEIAWRSMPPMNDEPPVLVDSGPWIVDVDLRAGRQAVRTGEIR